MQNIQLSDLLEAASAGGASALTEVTTLEPAAGAHASIAPARYVEKSGAATYAYETRYFEGKPAISVLVDSKSSVGNRIEEALFLAIEEGHHILSRMPKASVEYLLEGIEQTFTDLQCPHRIFDGHFRSAKIGDEPVTANEKYKAARDATPSNAMGMFQLSPITIALGGWDATRRSRQGRYPSLLAGEVIGILADQEGIGPREAKHSGARIDPVAASVQLEQAQLNGLIEQQSQELSKKFVEKNKKDAKGIVSGSVLGFGAIPPGVEDLSGVATSEIIRSYVLSLSGVRRLRFGKGVEGDKSLRALIIALLLNGMARANAELYLRANCHLSEKSAPVFTLNKRMGEHVEFAPLSIEAADALLEEAFIYAEKTAGLDWSGQTFATVGNPAILAGADDTSESNSK